MKWGVRRTPEQLGRKRQRAEKRKRKLSIVRNYTGSHRSDALKRSRRKDINKMSNQDLQKDINRLRLEKDYRSLTKIDTQFGRNYVNDYNKYNSSVRTATNTYAGKKAIKTGKRAVAAISTGH